MGEYRYEILSLSNEFYKKYSKELYPELLRKEDRPFDVMILKLFSDVYVCVPFRSDMKHKNGFHFHKSKRSKQHFSGLDYSKIVLLQDKAYLNDLGLVDRDELDEFYINIGKIYHEVLKYIVDYVNHITLKKVMRRDTYKRKYQYSTLPYFHKELHLLELHNEVYKLYMIKDHRLYINF